MTTRSRSLARPPGGWWREGAILSTAFGICLLGGVLQVDDTLAPQPGSAYLVALTSTAVLPLRHRAPVAALVGTTACGVLVAPLELLLTPLIVAPAAITAYSLAVGSSRRTTATALVSSAVVLVSSTAVFGELSWQDATRLVLVATFLLVAGVLGHATQQRRAYLSAVEERARHAEESRESEARTRVGEERVRIARELHDLVAHQITLANAQAAVATRVFDTRPEHARATLEQLVQTTRNALDDLRATVGLLRQSGDAVTPVEPAPGLSRLPELLQAFHRAGLEVSVHEEGTARTLPPGVDLTAYRIIQEALTNVTKHAGTGAARVTLTWSRDRVTITVSDDGHDTGDARTAASRAGYGLIGMRERATAVGGALLSGRRPEGGFFVTTHLPIRPSKGPMPVSGDVTASEADRHSGAS